MVKGFYVYRDFFVEAKYLYLRYVSFKYFWYKYKKVKMF